MSPLPREKKWARVQVVPPTHAPLRQREAPGAVGDRGVELLLDQLAVGRVQKRRAGRTGRAAQRREGGHEEECTARHGSWSRQRGAAVPTDRDARGVSYLLLT